MSASPSVVADAAAGDDFASCLGSAESHQSRLAVPPSSASPVAAVGPTTAAAAAGAAALQEAQVAADAAEAHPFLPTRFLNELAAANECLKRLPLPGGCSCRSQGRVWSAVGWGWAADSGQRLDRARTGVTLSPKRASLPPLPPPRLSLPLQAACPSTPCTPAAPCCRCAAPTVSLTLAGR